MIVAVGSTSPVKTEAVKRAFSTYFSEVEVQGFDVPSGIKAFPTSDTETVQGAFNRVDKVAEISGADFCVGLEGGLQELAGFTVIKQIAVVKRGGVYGLGVSSGYFAPERLIEQLDMTTDDSRKIIDRYYDRTEILSQEGVIGVMTNGVLNRTSTSRDAVVCALTRFINPDYY